MTYARSRLWLGIFGVGSIVVSTQALLFSGASYSIFSTTHEPSLTDITSLLNFETAFVALMFPLDLIGGLILPRFFGRQDLTARRFFFGWLSGIVLQMTLFLIVGLTIITVGRVGSRSAVVLLILIVATGFLAFQRLLAIKMTRGPLLRAEAKVGLAMDRACQWGLKPLHAIVVDHTDPGFTGGVVGLPYFESLILPRAWLDQLDTDQLSVAIARRLEALNTGSRTRGILLAVAWIIPGFAIASYLPGAGVTSIAELVTTCLGFTSWTFIGLLVLPTVSRQASYAIDSKVIHRGVPPELLKSMLKTLDRLQDDESTRPALIECIFHPVPSIENRLAFNDDGRPAAWHAARMMLFLSWSCLGLLARAVHCNVGRPELWVMLPTD